MSLFKWAILIIIFSKASFAQIGNLNSPGEPNLDIVAKEKNDQQKQEKKDLTPTTAEKESSIIDFQNIKNVLKNDRLEDQGKKIEKAVDKVARKRISSISKKYDIPSEDEFWSFFSEYWLVKNVSVLKWDFARPDYGLDDSFASFLQDRGLLEKKFKILLIDSPVITHFSLPTSSDEFIFILSLPFIRTLDLSKLEISMLLFEDLQRDNMGYFKSYLTTKELKKIWGTNFYQKKLDTKIFQNLLKKYDDFIFGKGFSFQQQYEVTKKMDQLMRSDLNLWNTYINLLKKIDNLVKTNLLYSKYAQMYPSPELQLNWLVPKKNK